MWLKNLEAEKLTSKARLINQYLLVILEIKLVA